MELSDNPPEENPDVEDGEITDDDEPIPPEQSTPAEFEPNPATAGAQPTIPVILKPQGNISDSDSNREPGESHFRDRFSDQEKSDDKDRYLDGRERDRGRKNINRKGRDRNNRDDKNHRHMTEAEKSILHLRKREKMMREREKWEKHHRKEIDNNLDDDFAKNIEKTLATILNKKEKEVAALSGEDSKDGEEKRGKKRKKNDRNKDNKSKSKHKRIMESPRSEEIDENEMLNIRSGSPGAEVRILPPTPTMQFVPPMDLRRSRSVSRSEDESYNSGNSEDEREERTRRRTNKNRRKKELRREKREREQRRKNNREAQKKLLMQDDADKVCVFYLQGKCQKNDCPYSHEVSPPMKLELCKFYLMDCCAKGENCSYMHSEFPCKFYHTGLQCVEGKDCKFAHGKPLSEGLKQILFKHIETAPRDILQGFPRLSRDEALNLINQTQKKMIDQLNAATSSEPNTTTTSTTTISTTPIQQNLGLGLYRETTEMTSTPDLREKDVPKGGIPSLFDINVPVPRELAQGLDFESPKSTKNKKGSRWQQDEDSSYAAKGFNNFGTDQDMRFTSNGDIDMRTLPTLQSTSSTNVVDNSLMEAGDNIYDDNNQKHDVDIRNFNKDVDHRFARNMDTDIRQRSFEEPLKDKDKNSKESNTLKFELPAATRDLLARINANQKDSIDETPAENQNENNYNEREIYDDQNINWYSDDDDDDDNRLTIKVEDEEIHNKREREESMSEKDTSNYEEQGYEDEKSSSFLSPPQFNTQTADIVNKLGDLSKIDISLEVTKLLTSMSQQKTVSTPAETIIVATSSSATVTSSPTREGGFSPRNAMPSDPRISKQVRQDPRLNDPRQRGRQNSTETKEKEKKSDKISIYEQGGIDMKKAALEIDRDEFKKADTDLRNMSLPFKGMQNYTPATEVDGSINSHPPMVWKLALVEIPRPDYTGLKLSISDAEKTGDPRLRKIFRLSTDEKDSPASPKASPKQSSSGGIRIDPRLRKIEEKPQLQDTMLFGQMSYNQQIMMLQSSQFYQSLTSNQKLMLNQELARADQSGGGGLNDPVLNTVLSNLNLLPQVSSQQLQAPLGGPNIHMGAATSILNNINKMNPMLQNQLIGQPGLLGAAPGIPNIPPNISQSMPQDFQMGFDPRGAPGLLGNAPPGANFAPQFGMDQQYSSGGYSDEYYGGYDDNMGGPQGGGNNNGNFRGGRGYNNNNNNRDGRRRGNRDGFRGGRGNNRNFNKRGGNRDKNDRDRRGNRGHSPS